MHFFSVEKQINQKETQTHEHQSLTFKCGGLWLKFYENHLLRTQSATVTTEKQQQQTSLSHFKA